MPLTSVASCHSRHMLMYPPPYQLSPHIYSTLPTSFHPPPIITTSSHPFLSAHYFMRKIVRQFPCPTPGHPALPHPTALLILRVPPAPAPSLKHAWSHLALRSPFPSPPPIPSTRIPAVDSLKLFLPILFSPSHESYTPHVIARVVLLALVGRSRHEARPLMRPRQAHAANRNTPAAESACGQTKIHSARKRKHRRPKESACSQTKLPVASTKTPASKQNVPAAEESTCGQFEVVIYKSIHLTSNTPTSTHPSLSPTPRFLLLDVLVALYLYPVTNV